MDKYVVVISQKTNKKNEVIGPSEHSKEYLEKTQTLKLTQLVLPWQGRGFET